MGTSTLDVPTIGVNAQSEFFGSLVFDGYYRTLKMFLHGAERYGKASGLLHTVECRDVGVGDAYVQAGADVYGQYCKCPPGSNYLVGMPEACATRNVDGSVTINHPDDAAYGCFFSGIADDPNADFSKHGRAGLGIHGGGTAAPEPFALTQGWYDTLGCLRLQNEDNERVFVPFVRWVLDIGGPVKLMVCYNA